jgi:hypothetical protein
MDRRKSSVKESVGRSMMQKQQAGAPPVQEWVSVAVLPPQLPRGMAPPSGVGAAGTFGWDEALNWQHNEPIEQADKPRKKSIMMKIGMTPERQRRSKDNGFPPYTMRQVRYETWRKHYAKDAEGNYRGTHAPAEDCLLKPDDVAKWRLEAPRTIGDLYTRGPSALPSYHEVAADGNVPEYDAEYDGPPVDDLTLSASRVPSMAQPGSEQMPERYIPKDMGLSEGVGNGAPGTCIIEGRTAADIIEEAKAKHAKEKADKKKDWKKSVKNGVTWGLLGTNY